MSITQKLKPVKSLENKVAIITGGGSGIGKAIAMLYSSEGAKIIISDIDEEDSKVTVAEIKEKGGDAIFVRTDTSVPDDSKNVVEQAVKQFGGLHIAVNNTVLAGHWIFKILTKTTYHEVTSIPTFSGLHTLLSTFFGFPLRADEPRKGVGNAVRPKRT